MQTEIEVKFLGINHDAMRARLQKAGAHLEQPMRLMRRTIFDWPDGRLEKSADAHVRVRDEGHRVTMTYKNYDLQLSVEGTKEVEITVNDFQAAVDLLQALGMVAKSQQESKRETWRLDDCEVVLDEWPWLKPFMEIEGPSQKSLKAVAKKLGLVWKDAISGSVTVAYRSEYNIPRVVGMGVNPRIAFGDPVPQWMQEIRLT